MRISILPAFLCLTTLESVFAQIDSILPSETNLIALCVGKSEVVAHVKVSGVKFIQRPSEADTGDLSVHGRLITLEVRHVYFQDTTFTGFPANIYLYRPGAVGGSFHEPDLDVGREYLVFLKAERAPDIVRERIIIEPPLPATNYFAFVRLPQRQLPNRKAYVTITDASARASVEKSLSEAVLARQKAGTPERQ